MVCVIICIQMSTTRGRVHVTWTLYTIVTSVSGSEVRVKVIKRVRGGSRILERGGVESSLGGL